VKATRTAIDAFFAQRTMAVVGVSRNTQAFANAVFRTLRDRGYRVFPVNPHAERLEGSACYRRVSAIPERVGGAVVVLPSAATEDAVRDILESGVKHVWIHRGSETPSAVEQCTRKGVNLVSGECPMMFLDPVGGPHRIHRWIRTLLGRAPVST
jgi:predicted CoA-binding protein